MSALDNFREKVAQNLRRSLRNGFKLIINRIIDNIIDLPVRLQMVSRK